MKIALIGMMGTGKTVTGKRLAERLQFKFTDLDEIVVARVGMPISQAFITFGEKVFRSYESSVLLEVVWEDDIVISCGGGVPLNEENMARLDDALKVRLTCSPEEIYDRTKDDISRPLLKKSDPEIIAGIIKERESVYARYADVTVDTTDRKIDDIVDEIIAKLNQKLAAKNVTLKDNK